MTALLLGSGGSGEAASSSTAAPAAPKGNTVPVYVSLPADLLTPVMAYLRLSGGADAGRRSFLCESIVNGEKIARYSFAGVGE